MTADAPVHKTVLSMELAITLLIVALAAAIVLRRTWRLFRQEGKSGCGSGCGSCPGAPQTAKELPLVSLEFRRKPSPSH